jgi:hypothetical protein
MPKSTTLQLQSASGWATVTVERSLEANQRRERVSSARRRSVFTGRQLAEWPPTLNI